MTNSSPLNLTPKGTLFVKPRSTKDLMKCAKNIRSIAGKSGFLDDHKLDIAGFFETLAGALPDTFKLHIAAADEFPDHTHEGLTMPDGEILIREDIYHGGHNNVPRDRFTMTHELIHWVLHRKEFGLARSQSEVPLFRDPEWQANTGASLALMPTAAVQTCNGSPGTLAQMCGVSIPAAISRLRLYTKYGF